jgi:outer membrane protein assembly factor BamA
MLIKIFKFLLIPLLIFGLYYSSFSQIDDTTKINIVKEVKIIGNKTTRDNIILREIPFIIGDTIAKENLDEIIERTHSNLLNTSLFNFVTVEPVYFDDILISIYITVEERWYWWPIPIFDIEETNFNTWWQDKDYDKVNYGLFLAKENFRGRKETIMFKVQGGYTEQLGVKYIIPYINKNKTQGISAKFSYSRNHEVTFGTTNNIRDYYRSENDYIKKEISTNIGYEIRPKLYNKHIFYLEYRDIEVADSVVLLNKNFLTEGNNFMRFLSLNYTFKRDKRNNKSYPTKGYYYDLFVVKDGLGVIDKDLNSLYFTSQVRRFWELSNRIYFSGSIKAKFTIKDSPYYFNNAMGFHNDFVRGYELYVINGEHFSIVKTQLRYALLKNKVFKINAIPANKFNKIPLGIYVGAFFDAGYVDSKVNNKNNFLVNSTLYGGGVGVDFVSYYDIVFRVEYSINKLNEQGLFLHFIAPI